LRFHDFFSNLLGSGSIVKRRDLLKQLGAGAAAVALPRFTFRFPAEPLVVAGQPAELTVESVSAVTVRLTLRAIDRAAEPIAYTGALVQDDFGRPVARGRDVSALTRVRAGDLTVAVATSPTPTITVRTRRGELVQTLT